MKNHAEFVTAKSHAVLSTGEVIRMLRDLKGWTQGELASHSGISVTNISLLENSKRDVQAVAFSPDGKVLASGSSDNRLFLWDVATAGSIITIYKKK